MTKVVCRVPWSESFHLLKKFRWAPDHRFSWKKWILYISQVAQRLKHLPAMRETWVQSLGQEDPLEKEMATHSSILAWRIPWTEEPGGLQSTGSQRVGHGWVTSLSLSNYGESNEDNGDLLQKVPRMYCYTQCPQPCSRPPGTQAPAGDSCTLTGKSGSVSCGVTALFSLDA